VAKIQCEIEQVELKGDNGRTVAGTRATCTQCDHVTESFGTSPASIRRCLALMAEECEDSVDGERNFYVDKDE